MLDMFQKGAANTAVIEALSRSQAVIEFKVDGTILTANENFLNALGYTLAEIQGQHHSMFVDSEERNSDAYKVFWDRLARGEFFADEFRRIRKDGREIWIQATYNPIIGAGGRVAKVVKFASDITAQKNAFAAYEAQIDAINRSQAVITFELDGTIVDANDNFCGAMGYELSEIKGKHHSMFAEPEYARSAEYKEFWEALRSGKFHAGEYRRLAKGGREIWIQASYNPIMDAKGKPVRVTKFATDITAQVHARQRNEQISKVVLENMSRIATAIGNADEQASSASSGSTETLSMVQTVAAAMEEMQGSVAEISRSMDAAQRATGSVETRITQTGTAIEGLKEKAAAMTSIVELINNITGQINLLALNATIESARAGEAGRGFAVVAGEVKNLAVEATSAMSRISEEIDAMQATTDDVADALTAIREAFNAVQESVGGVASAVEQQTAVTRDISANMQTAATAVSSIDESLSGIVNVTKEASEATETVRKTIAMLQ